MKKAERIRFFVRLQRPAGIIDRPSKIVFLIIQFRSAPPPKSPASNLSEKGCRQNKSKYHASISNKGNRYRYVRGDVPANAQIVNIWTGG
jgi:hypothetical protein